jgi:transposase
MIQGGEGNPGFFAKEWLMPVTSPTYRLSDHQWQQLQDLLPPNGQRGGQWKDHRTMIDGILWALSDGGRWRNLPLAFGPWQSVYDRFRNWSRRGLWERILRRLQARKIRRDEIDWSLFCIDGTVVRAHQSAAGAGEKKGRPASRATTRSGGARAASGPRST